MLKKLADHWHSLLPNGNPGFPDFTFFYEFEKAKIKIPQGKVAMVRNYFGVKDPSQNTECRIKPTKMDSGFAPDPELKDSEIIPWKTDTDEFLEANVRPYAPDFWYDCSETKIGYEIPFTREFYRYEAPRPAAEIFEHFRSLGEREQELMAKILGK